MAHPFGRMQLIVNRFAGRRRGSRVPALLHALREHRLAYELHETTGPQDATTAAREAVQSGCRYLIAVGGDGTVNEVVNGMFDGTEPRNPDAVLGVVSAGSGCDFARTFGLNVRPEELVRHFATDDVQPIDVGRVSFLDHDGNPAERLFANVAQAGYGAEVVRQLQRYPRWLGRFRYLLGAWAAIPKMTRPETTIELASAARTLALVELVVANAQFFGGGMKVAPRALPDDGRFSVLAFFGGRSQVFILTQKLYRGEHVPHPQIAEWQSATVAVEPNTPLLVEADGELLGTTPASFSLVERSLLLKI